MSRSHSCKLRRIERETHGFFGNFLCQGGYLSYCQVSRISESCHLKHSELPTAISLLHAKSHRPRARCKHIYRFRYRHTTAINQNQLKEQKVYPIMFNKMFKTMLCCNRQRRVFPQWVAIESCIIDKWRYKPKME